MRHNAGIADDRTFERPRPSGILRRLHESGFTFTLPVRGFSLPEIHSVNSPMHHNGPVVVRSADANSAVRSDAAGPLDAMRANDCVGIIRDKSGENESDQQCGNENLH